MTDTQFPKLSELVNDALADAQQREHDLLTNAAKQRETAATILANAKSDEQEAAKQRKAQVLLVRVAKLLG